MTPNEPMDDVPDPALESLVRAALTPEERRDATRARLLMRAKSTSAPRRSYGVTIALAAGLAASLVLLVRAKSERDEFVESLTGPKVTVVGLTAGATKTPRALMFWDKATNRWTFIAHNMPALGAGRTYQLWLVTAGQKISAGTFSVTAGGDALVQATYVLDPNALKAVAVTEEPAGGVSQPTGAMVVVGTAGAQ
jgi:hypothetical protein